MRRISTVRPKSRGGDWIGYLRPDQFLDHLTVIITHFVLMIHALLTQILKYCFCAIFSCVLSVCAIFFPFSDFGPLGKRKKHCERQSGPRLSSAYESNLVKSYHKFKHKSLSNFRISTRHQLQHLNQTSASRRNLKLKTLTKHSFRISTKIQLHDLHKTSAVKY